MLDEAGRAARVGAALDCPLCDRAEFPEGLVSARVAGPFDDVTLPPALRRAHRVAERTWGCLRVLGGSVRFTMEVEPPLAIELQAGERQAIPPGVAHAVVVDGPVRLTVVFFVAAPHEGARP